MMPKTLQDRTLAIAHKEHPGIVAVENRLRSKVWWDGVDKAAENIVKSCKGCQLVQKMAEAAPLTRNPLPDKPWGSLAVDLLGQLPSGDNLFVIIFVIIVIIDYYSRYYEIEILRSGTTDVIIDRLHEIFARHGFPKNIACANGPQFANEKLHE